MLSFFCSMTLLGEEGVGKSSLKVRFTEETFSEGFICNYADNFKYATIEALNKRVKLQIWDTVPYKNPYSIHCRGQCYLVLFDRTNKSTLNKIDDLLDASNGFFHFSDDDSQVPLILVGTKSDEPDCTVNLADVEEFIKKSKYVFNHYIETSAKTGENINEVFATAAEISLERKGVPRPEKEIPSIELETAIKKLFSITHTYISKSAGDHDKIKIFTELQKCLSDSSSDVASERIKKFNQTFTKVNTELLAKHRTADWKRYAYNILSVLALCIPMIVRICQSNYKYETCRFWQPESEQARSALENVLRQSAVSQCK